MGKKQLSRRSQLKARRRKLEAMSSEEKEAFLKAEMVQKQDAMFVRKRVHKLNAFISSSPKPEDRN